MDFAEEKAICLGMWRSASGRLGGFFNSKLALFEEKVFDIDVNYASIVSGDEGLIAALIRRNGGESAAFDLLKVKLKYVGNTEHMKYLVGRIGPWIRSPLSQIRFTRAIQFSGITNPHLILIGLLTFVLPLRLIGRDALDERAEVPLWEMMFHPSCRSAARGWMTWSGMRFNKVGLRTVLSLYGNNGFKIDVRQVTNILDYVEVCKEMGYLEMARKLLMRTRMTGIVVAERDRFLQLEKQIETQQ
jgi:hypothetical protein